jgi:FkbM family methyltransferase
MLKRLFRHADEIRRTRTARNLRERFMALQKEIRPQLFVEVGAYDATTSLDVRKILPDARIVAFEANPFNHEHFSSKHHHDHANVEYLFSAVAETPGPRTFKLTSTNPEGLSKKSSILGRSDSKRTYEDVTVPCTTLDLFFENAMPIQSSLWIDVEGASRHVLEGAETLLATARSILIEVEERSFWQGQWLASDVIRHLARFGLKVIDRDYEYREQYNILFLRET